MRIVYNIAGMYRPSGMEKIITDKANWLAAHGYEVTIITTEQKGRPDAFELDSRVARRDLAVGYEDNNGASLLDKLVHYPLKQYRHRKRLTRVLMEIRPDVTVSTFCNEQSFLTGIKDGSHKVLELHFSRLKRLQYGRKGLWGLVDRIRSANEVRQVRRFDRFVTLTREDLAQWGDIPAMCSIPNGIRLDDITAGKIVFDGDDISGKMSPEVEGRLRTNMSMVFQDPMASLNPYRKVIDTIATGLDAHNPHLDRREREQRVYEIMDRVGLSRSQANRYPSQFSGGQRQRVGLARALIMNPKLLIADEAISALDVSIQAQVVNLMKDIQDETGAAYLFIAHDLSMVRYISRRIAVMHLGHIVEAGLTDEIFANPIHPYTKALISAIPRFNPQIERGRKPLVYDAGTSGIRYDEGTYHAVSDSHQVLATSDQIEAWVR